MKNIKIQTKSGHCGIYNLANILQDERILEYSHDIKYVPCGISETNKILNLEGYDFVMHPIIEPLNFNIEIPKIFFNSVMDNIEKNTKSNTTHIFPLILSVMAGCGETGLHAISLMYFNGKFAMSDPRYDRYEIIEKLDVIFEKYKYVNSISGFVNPNTYEFLALDANLYDTSIFK